MKFRLPRTALIALPLLVLLVGYSVRNTPAAVAVRTFVATTVDDLTPQPSPTPTEVPTPVPTVAPTVIPPAPVAVPTVEPEPTPPLELFPTIAPKPTILPGNVQPTLVPVPQTNIFIGISAINGGNPDTDEYKDGSTGGYKCIAPCTVTYWCEFQGGFPGIAPVITWDGTAVRSGCSQTAATAYTVTYSAGVHRATLTATEVYQGHKYVVPDANPVTVTVS